MSISVWASLVAACAVISFTPGAGAINTMSNALTVGWRRSIWGIIGQQLALVVHIAIAGAGLGVLVTQSPVLFGVIRYVGAAYLVYLGLRMLLLRPSAAGSEGAAADADASADPGADRAAPPTASARSMLLRGLWVNLLNPKAIVFFLAFIPQFVRADQPQLPQYIVLGVTAVGVDVLVMWGFFAAAARPFGRYAATRRGQRILNGVFGVLFIGVAALLLFVH